MGVNNTLNAIPKQYQWKNTLVYEEAYNFYSLFLGINTEDLKERIPTENL